MTIYQEAERATNKWITIFVVDLELNIYTVSVSRAVWYGPSPFVYGMIGESNVRIWKNDWPKDEKDKSTVIYAGFDTEGKAKKFAAEVNRWRKMLEEDERKKNDKQQEVKDEEVREFALWKYPL